MANIWNENRNNAENQGSVYRNKQYLSSRSFSVKKPFGDLKHLQNQQGGAVNNTPFNAKTAKTEVFDAISSASKSLCNDTFRKSRAIQNCTLKSKFEEAAKTTTATTSTTKALPDGENLYEYWDVSWVNCGKSCYKSDEEIWNEMNNVKVDVLETTSAEDTDTEYEFDNKGCDKKHLDDDDHLDNSFIYTPLFSTDFDVDGDEGVNLSLDLPDFEDVLNDFEF